MKLTTKMIVITASFLVTSVCLAQSREDFSELQKEIVANSDLYKNSKIKGDKKEQKKLGDIFNNLHARQSQYRGDSILDAKNFNVSDWGKFSKSDIQKNSKVLSEEFNAKKERQALKKYIEANGAKYCAYKSAMTLPKAATDKLKKMSDEIELAKLNSKLAQESNDLWFPRYTSLTEMTKEDIFSSDGDNIEEVREVAAEKVAKLEEKYTEVFEIESKKKNANIDKLLKEDKFIALLNEKYSITSLDINKKSRLDLLQEIKSDNTEKELLQEFYSVDNKNTTISFAEFIARKHKLDTSKEGLIKSYLIGKNYAEQLELLAKLKNLRKTATEQEKALGKTATVTNELDAFLNPKLAKKDKKISGETKDIDGVKSTPVQNVKPPVSKAPAQKELGFSKTK